MSAASRILPFADCFCWRADMSASTSPFRYMNGVQATPLDAPVHETGDVQGGRDDAYAVANDLSCDEESVHNQGLLNWHIFGSGADRVGHLRPMRVHTDWLVCCQVASAAYFCIASQVTARYVRFGSKADMCSAKRDVRFTPKSAHPSAR